MTSVFNSLLIKLQNRIIAGVPDSPLTPGIRLVDQDLGQLDIYEIRPAVAFPCVLIDYGTTSYEQKQLKTQWGHMAITLRLAFDPWSKSNSLAPEVVRAKALAYYEIENLLYLTLQDWHADGLLMLPMKRISDTTEKRDDKFRVRQIVFKATYEDRSLQAGGNLVPPINPLTFRIDWIVAFATKTFQDNRLKGKTIAHIMVVSKEGDDKFIVIDQGAPSDKQVLLDPVAGSLTFLYDAGEGEQIWAQVLSN